MKVLFLGTPSYGGRFSDASGRMRRALKAAERQKCDATEIDPSDALCNQQAIYIWVLIACKKPLACIFVAQVGFFVVSDYLALAKVMINKTKWAT